MNPSTPSSEAGQELGTTTDKVSEVQEQLLRWRNERFGLGPAVRAINLAAAALLIGTVTGIIYEYPKAAVRFRAENAHRLPRSEKNWFFYGRAKSLTAMSSAMAYGPKMGFRMIIPTVTFSLIENGIDDARGGNSKDFISTTIAGVSTAGLYSLATRQAIPEVSRLFKIGFKAGLFCGLGQDMLSYISGRPLFYVPYLQKLWGSTENASLTAQDV